MTALFYAHSGLRYLVLLAAAVAVAHAALALLRGTDQGRTGRVLYSVFVGLIDLQLLLGLAVLLIGGIWYPALTGHLITMVLAVVVAHGSAVLAKGSEDARRAASLRLGGALVTLALLMAGIRAIGRGVFESGAPTLGG